MDLKNFDKNLKVILFVKHLDNKDDLLNLEKDINKFLTYSTGKKVIHNIGQVLNNSIIFISIYYSD